MKISTKRNRMWPACRDDVLLRFRIFSENDVVQKRILPNHRVRRISQIIYTVYLCSSVGIRVIILRVSCCSSTSDDVVRVEVRDKLEILSNIREHHVREHGSTPLWWMAISSFVDDFPAFRHSAYPNMEPNPASGGGCWISRALREPKLLCPMKEGLE